MMNIKDYLAMGLCLFYSFLSLIYMFIMRMIKGKEYFELKKQTMPNSKKFLEEMEIFNQHNVQDLPSRGIKLHYVCLGDRSKPMMLFIHGFPDFWYMWRHQLKHFSKDYWVVAVDQRGYGESDKPEGVDSYRGVELTDDMKEFIQSFGKSSAIVVGHDWGGFVSWSLTMRYPEVVNRLVIINCPHPVSMNQALTSSLSQFISSWYMFFFQMRKLPEMNLIKNNFEMFDKMFSRSIKKGHSTNDDVQYYKYNWSQPKTLTCAINYYRANIWSSNNRFLKEKPANISTPTLLLWGEKDPYLTLQAAVNSVKYVDSLRVRLNPDAGHWLHTEEPEFVNTNIEEFLNSNNTC